MRASASKSERFRARFRAAGVLVLVLGISGAGLLYWIRTRSPDPADDPLLAGYAKPEMRQMEILYGKMGQISMDLMADLKRPAVQAIVIAVASIAVALACFFVADRWTDGEAK